MGKPKTVGFMRTGGTKNSGYSNYPEERHQDEYKTVFVGHTVPTLVFEHCIVVSRR